MKAELSCHSLRVPTHQHALFQLVGIILSLPPSESCSTSAQSRGASQTLRVGYGHLISDLLEQLKTARAAAETAAAAAAAATTKAPPRPVQNGGTVESGRVGNSPPNSSDRFTGGDGGDSGGPTAPAARTGGAAMALIGLQRFGGKCVRSLAEGAVFA